MLKIMQKNLAACLEPVYLELQMWEERRCSWWTQCAQQWGHKKPCRSSRGEPAPQHPRVSVRGADSDPHASHALSPKPKEAGQRHSSAPQLQCSALSLVCTKPRPCLMSHRPDAVLQTPLLCSARSTQDEDSVFLYLLLTLGLPLGIPRN